MAALVHPGRVLKRELTARELSANRFALAIRVPSGRVTDILNQKRGITPETALRFARFFGTSAEFWMNLQARYDLGITESKLGATIADEVRPLPDRAKAAAKRR